MTTKSEFPTLKQHQKTQPKIVIHPQKKPSFFSEIDQKIKNEYVDNRDIDESIEQKARELFEKEQYERYKQDYIKIIRMKPEEGNMNKYQKDLLKNEIKLRETIGAEWNIDGLLFSFLYYLIKNKTFLNLNNLYT